MNWNQRPDGGYTHATRPWEITPAGELRPLGEAYRGVPLTDLFNNPVSPVSGISSGLLLSRPAAGSFSGVYFATDDGYTYFSNGSAWSVLSVPVTAGAAFSMEISAVTSSPTKATSPDEDLASWRRVGDSIEISYSYYSASPTGAGGGSGAYLFGLPSGLTADVSKIPVSTSDAIGVVGVASAHILGSVGFTGFCRMYDSQSMVIQGVKGGGSYVSIGSAELSLANANIVYSLKASVPISGWGPTL